jgi:hypothetical protein
MMIGSFGSFVTHGKVLWRMVAAGTDPLRGLQKHGDSSTSISDRYRFSCGRLRRFVGIMTTCGAWIEARGAWTAVE